MDERLVWIDVSRYQNPEYMHYEVMAEQGQVKGVIAKCSQGMFGQDRRFVGHLEAGKAAGMWLGAYHWHDPMHDVNRQLSNMREVIRPVVEELSFLALDVEQYWADWLEWSARRVVKIIPGAVISRSAYELVNLMLAEFALPVVVYTRRSFIVSWAPQMSTWIGSYPVWLAQYPYTKDQVMTTWEMFYERYTPRMDGPTLPHGASTWAFWQFSGDKFRLPGSGGLIDLNYFNGDEKTFEVFCETGSLPVAEEPVAEEYMTLYRLNLRDAPGVDEKGALKGKIVGKVAMGKRVKIMGYVRQGADLWGLVGKDLWLAIRFRSVQLMRAV